MFETSVVTARAAAARSRASLLSVSIAAHSLAAVAIVAVSIQSIQFPTDAPRQFSASPSIFRIEIPKPLGNPNGGAKPKPVQQQQTAAPKPTAITAPTTVPDQVTAASNTTNSVATNIGTPTDVGDGTGTEPGPRGVPDGDPNAIDLGEPIVASAEPTGPMIITADVRPPVVIHRVAPIYPEMARRIRMNGFVVVHCIIGKDGRVRDPQISRSSFSAFEQSALDAVKQWRFSPAIYRDKPVDAWFDLTVTFHVN